MRPTRVLSRQHQVLLRFLETFGRVVEIAVRQGGIPRSDLGDAVEFLAVFGHDYHHHLEEEHLFDRLQRVGLHRSNAPVAFLSAEHRKGRELLDAIRVHVAGAADGDPLALRALAHLARALVDEEIDHIEKEDRILFPLADELLTPADDRVILAGFEALREELGEDVLERQLIAAERLRRTYGPGQPLEGAGSESEGIGGGARA